MKPKRQRGHCEKSKEFTCDHVKIISCAGSQAPFPFQGETPKAKTKKSHQSLFSCSRYDSMLHPKPVMTPWSHSGTDRQDARGGQISDQICSIGGYGKCII